MNWSSPYTSILAAWLAANPRIYLLFLNLAVAAAYWLMASLALGSSGTGARLEMPFWPAAGVGVAAAFLGGRRLLPGLALGMVAVTVATSPVLAVVLYAAFVVASAVAASRLLTYFAFNPRMERIYDAAVLTLVVAPITSAAAVAVALPVFLLANGLPLSTFPSLVVVWLLRDWVGVVVVAPVLFTWTSARPLPWSWPRVTEAIALAFVMAVGVQVMFDMWGWFGPHPPPLVFVAFPLVAWAALRFGPRGSALVVAALAGCAVVAADRGPGLFGEYSVSASQLLLLGFLGCCAFAGQVLAAVMSEREDAIERRLMMEEQLRHSQKMEAVGRLAGGIAHDFNNLLTAIIGYTEIVLSSLDPADERRADAEEIGRAAMRAADLTRQMLAFSRKQGPQTRIVDINSAIAKIDPLLRRVLGEDIVMVLSQKAQTPLVRVDRGQVDQIIMNLVVNARDAMPQGGRLTVETTDVVLDERTAAEHPDAKPGHYVQLMVSDTGTGMTPEVRARIFEPYFTTKEVGKGTGLGLSTVYGIVQQSDGHMSVVSELGFGTTLRVFLPRAEGALPAVDSSVQTMPSGKEHVLLVEDDGSVRRLTRDLLVRLGYTVTEAASGRAGLALGSDDTRHFDLAVCDVILGDMSGPAVAEALQALRPSIRVLYMSGYADDAIVRTGVLDEGKPFLQKPFTPLQLARKIRDVLSVDSGVVLP